jgi:hypothetical protein
MLPQFKWELDETMIPSKIMKLLYRSLAGWQDLFDDEFCGIVSVKFGNPSDGKFAYPADPAHTEANVEAKRKAERNLDRFWKFVDNECRKYTGAAQQKNIQRVLKEGGKLRRTGPWVEKSGSDGEDAPKDAYDFIPLSEVYHEPTKDITGNFDRLTNTSKSKNKTRGSGTASTEVGIKPSSNATESIQRSLYHVDKDSLIVFRTLFHQPNDGELPRTIRWTDIVSALTKLGFSAEQLQSSAWQFKPTIIKLNRGIQFHEPHPDDEVPLWLARRYGRRLERAYDWDGTMFRQK